MNRNSIKTFINWPDGGKTGARVRVIAFALICAALATGCGDGGDSIEKDALDGTTWKRSDAILTFSTPNCTRLVSSDGGSTWSNDKKGTYTINGSEVIFNWTHAWVVKQWNAESLQWYGSVIGNTLRINRYPYTIYTLQ